MNFTRKEVHVQICASLDSRYRLAHWLTAVLSRMCCRFVNKLDELAPPKILVNCILIDTLQSFHSFIRQKYGPMVFDWYTSNRSYTKNMGQLYLVDNLSNPSSTKNRWILWIFYVTIFVAILTCTYVINRKKLMNSYESNGLPYIMSHYICFKVKYFQVLNVTCKIFHVRSAKTSSSTVDVGGPMNGLSFQHF